MSKTIQILSILLVLFFIDPFMAAAKLRIVERRGGKKVQAVKFDNGDWMLLVNKRPYFIKGVIYVPVRIGESPAEETMNDWMTYDTNGNGVNDVAYEVWVDKNKNNKQDADEKPVGDFQILKDMGCNTIRLYHLPSNNSILGSIYKKNASFQKQYAHEPNKKLLRELYSKYGIRVIMGSFLGSWTVGAGVPYDDGCDYTDPKQRENIKKSVRAMVEDHKDEPYVLMWMLGNENNIATWSQCNANENIKTYYLMVNDIAKMVHQMDPDHPVAFCEGYNPKFVPLYSKFVPEVDIIAYNAYMGDSFGDMWKTTKKHFNRPVMVSEYGIFAYNTIDGFNEDQQLKYHKGCYADMIENRAGSKGVGNCIGGVIFDYLDRWYMDGEPGVQNPGTKSWPFSPDSLDHEEYFGITSMGDGKHNLFKRQLRKAYFFYQEQWKKKQ